MSTHLSYYSTVTDHGRHVWSCLFSERMTNVLNVWHHGIYVIYALPLPFFFVFFCLLNFSLWYLIPKQANRSTDALSQGFSKISSSLNQEITPFVEKLRHCKVRGWQRRYNFWQNSLFYIFRSADGNVVSMSLFGNIFLVVKGLSFSNLVHKYKSKWWKYQNNFFSIFFYLLFYQFLIHIKGQL